MATPSSNTPFPTSSVSPAVPAPGVIDAAPDAKPQGEPADVVNRVAQVAHVAHGAIDRVAETAAPAVQRLQDVVRAAGDTLTQRASDARALGDEWTESVRCTVRQHPIAALATALALGVLVARLSRI